MHHINEYKEDYDHSPIGNYHVEPRLNHMNKDEKCQKRILTWYLRAQMTSDPTIASYKFGLGIACNQ